MVWLYRKMEVIWHNQDEQVQTYIISVLELSFFISVKLHPLLFYGVFLRLVAKFIDWFIN